ncbi:hypothetical protein Nazgul09 [Burkholderia phage BcepNazgul]|uniref:Uncharacterized protein n=1 Tax=Burkholderia phage BcepNazgul TaxID=242861 RepID=Q6UYF6_9CAUD|nr:hypothetical protein Nazgul09 [Burkholderia phage BcepNazgul]AAQ63385.1 hypothetical protein Nazgul09 [Burkholderia phage BcepNazgul]
MTPEQIQTAARHFIIAALWADAPEGSRPRATAESRETARRFVYAFAERYPQTVAAMLATNGYGAHPDCGFDPAAALGQDIYLTCAGHGAGFADRGEHGERLLAFVRRDWRMWHVDCEFYRGWLYLIAAGCKQIVGAPNDGE